MYRLLKLKRSRVTECSVRVHRGFQRNGARKTPEGAMYIGGRGRRQAQQRGGIGGRDVDGTRTKGR